jgi:Family of unknown function (DUF5677)
MNIPELLELVIDSLTEKAAVLKFDSERHVDLIRMAMYGFHLDVVRSIGVLEHHEAHVAVRPLLRTLIEGHVDLLNMYKDPDFFFRYEAADSEQWMKILKAAQDEGNQSLAGLAADPLVKEIIANPEKSPMYANRTVGSLSIFDRFAEVGLEHVYRGLYSFLCLSSHANMSTLTSRYIDLSSDKPELQIFPAPNAGESAKDLKTAVSILLDAASKTHENYGPSELDSIEELKIQLDEIIKRANN